MILTLFIALLALCVVLLFLGYFTDDEPYVTVGLFFLFMLSIVILSGQLEYQTGANYTTSSVTNVYTSWNDTTSHWIGYGLAVGSAMGIALSLYNTSKKRKKEEQEYDE